jgi:hypothetical protein
MPVLIGSLRVSVIRLHVSPFQRGTGESTLEQRGALEQTMTGTRKIGCSLRKSSEWFFMARKVKTAVQSEIKAAECLASALEVDCNQSQGESIEEVVKNLKEAIDRYMEALAAEENENRLSR